MDDIADLSSIFGKSYKGTCVIDFNEPSVLHLKSAADLIF